MSIGYSDYKPEETTLREARELEIPLAIAKLNGACDILADHLSELKNRLNPIMRSLPPSSQPEEAKKESMTIVASQINDIREKVLILGSTVGDIISKLEL